MTPTLESLERLMRALELPMETLWEAQRFVCWVGERSQLRGWRSVTRSAWNRPDEVREPQARWEAGPPNEETRGEELARLFRAWIREEVAKSVERK